MDFSFFSITFEEYFINGTAGDYADAVCFGEGIGNIGIIHESCADEEGQLCSGGDIDGCGDTVIFCFPEVVGGCVPVD